MDSGEDLLIAAARDAPKYHYVATRGYGVRAARAHVRARGPKASALLGLMVGFLLMLGIWLVPGQARSTSFDYKGMFGLSVYDVYTIVLAIEAVFLGICLLSALLLFAPAAIRMTRQVPPHTQISSGFGPEHFWLGSGGREATIRYDDVTKIWTRDGFALLRMRGGPVLIEPLEIFPSKWLSHITVVAGITD